MTESTPDAAPSVSIDLRLRYTHPLGELTPYFAGLERGVAMGTRCRSCRRTWFAPRLCCTCGAGAMDWVALSGRGTVVALTRSRTTLPGSGVTGEFEVALIRMEGTDNLCFGRLGAATPPLVRGSTVRLVRAQGDWAHPAQCAQYVSD